jgi:hypothetical protein
MAHIEPHIACESVEVVPGEGLHLYRLKEPDKSGFLETLESFLGSRKYPGPNPCSIERKDLPKLASQPYMVAPKSDGTRFALLASTYKKKRILCIMNRARDVFVVPVRNLPRAMAQGTIMDAELLFPWRSLLVFDVVAACGVPTFSIVPFSQRLAIADKVLSVYKMY